MQESKFKVGQIVYIIANGSFIKEARVVHTVPSTKMYTIKFTEGSGGTKLRESRLYASQKEAEKALKSKLFQSKINF